MVMNKLKQSSAFRPFPRELSPFTLIAMCASNHKVGNVIGRDISTNNTRKRECMVNMMVSPLHFFTTIIALAFLPIVLFMNLLRGVFACNCSFTRRAIAITCIIFCLVSLVVLSFFFFMQVIVRQASLTRRYAGREFASRRRLLSLKGFFWTGFLWTGFAFTCFTPRKKAKLASSICMEIVSCSRKGVLASSTPFVPLGKNGHNRLYTFTIGCATLLTRSIQSTLCARISKEKFGSRRKKLTASTFTLLQRGIIGEYNIKHSETSPNQMRSLGLVGVSSTFQAVSICPHYSINAPQKLVHLIER